MDRGMVQERISPQGLLLLSFAGLILIGGFALWMPYAARGAPLRFIDALFTSTSAVCVTGLVVVDTATRFSTLGQATLVLLIQCGGLGILTLSTFFLVALGKKITLGQREILATTHAPVPWVDRYALVRKIVFYTLTIEGVGFLFLLIPFLPDYGFPAALFHAAFHSVAAFCNAGFSTFTPNLMGYRDNITVNLAIMALIVLGGLGFLVLLELENLMRFHRRLSLHARLVLIATAALILAGAAGFLLLEYENILKPMPWNEKLLTSLFQSVTPRTAGFNTVNYAELNNATLQMTLALMFFGGAPGSTAGGVKVTSLSLMLLLGWARLQGRSRVNIFSRTIPEKSINEALLLFMISVVLITLVIMGLQVTELGMAESDSARGKFLDLTFETVSAFGTVGLSTGVTGTLSDSGKILIMLLMYIGRLGPLTLVLYVSRRTRRAEYAFYEEEVVIG
jgi:trk system potassium uptake protein